MTKLRVAGGTVSRTVPIRPKTGKRAKLGDQDTITQRTVQALSKQPIHSRDEYIASRLITGFKVRKAAQSGHLTFVMIGRLHGIAGGGKLVKKVLGP